MARTRADPSAETATTELATSRGDRLELALLVCRPEGVSLHALPKGGSLSIGRHDSCGLSIDDASVSRRHAVIHAEPPARVEDCGSRNGTRLQGARLGRGEVRPLFPGAVLEFGSVTVFVQRESSALRRRLADFSPQVAPASTRHAPIVADRTMRDLHALVEVVAPSRLAVLLLGETGVGKEVFAAAIHGRSPRAGRAFVRLHCAALPDTLLEAELFGYERGAFTGATQAKPGLFELADGGSVFLDEIGELPLATQAKLLRVLESGEVQRLGSVAPRIVDARVISATNRDLGKMVADKAFRADLFYRLNGIALTIPPLRTRPDDLPALARHFASEAHDRLGAGPTLMTPAALERLAGHDWPGNVRELRNVIERAVLLAHDATELDEAAVERALSWNAGPTDAAPASPPQPAPLAAPPAESPAPRPVRRKLDRDALEIALRECGGNQSRAAKLLGMSRRAFVKRLDEHQITRPRKRYD